MEQGQDISKESFSDTRSSIDCQIFEVNEENLQNNIKKTLELFKRAWDHVHAVDSSILVEVVLNNRQEMVPKYEALFYWYLISQQSRIKLMLLDGDFAGILIYNEFLEGVHAIRLLYVDEKYRALKLGRKLVKEIENVKLVIFQTKKDNEPRRLMDVVGTGAIKLAQNDLVSTFALGIN